ncbi:MAG: hypothetical protein M3044_13875 [Thermoproteota archaeon]|nr:hypothetical protein [Thermoproteota archaeon]
MHDFEKAIILTVFTIFMLFSLASARSWDDTFYPPQQASAQIYVDSGIPNTVWETLRNTIQYPNISDIQRQIPSGWELMGM